MEQNGQQRVWHRGMNAEQLAVIDHNGGPCVVDAGAGSGKTRAVVHRVARIAAETGTPGRILAVTFSAKAAGEMNDRLAKLGVSGARVGTWHSLCLQIIREDGLDESAWDVDDKDRAKIVLKDVIGWKGMKWETDFGKLRSFIGICKAFLATPASDQAAEVAYEVVGPRDANLAIEAYSRYQDELERKGLLTFDDFLVVANRHLAIDDNREAWASRWDYVIQDEAQDANYAQVRLAEALAKDHRNYMIVGDVAQSIYGFRGSDPKYLATFAEKWPGAKVVNMRRNYRSVDAVVTLANDAIRPGEFRGPDMIPERGVAGDVRAEVYANFDAEAEAFAAWAKSYHDSGDGTWADNTALFRTNAQSRALEEALLSLSIPYVVVGGTSFYERKEVRDLLAYLRLAVRGNGADVEDVKRCINAPFRYLGSAFVAKVQDQAARAATDGWIAVARDVATREGIQARQRRGVEEWASILDAISAAVAPTGSNPAKPGDVLDALVRDTRYMEFLRKEEGEESLESSQASNVRELVRVAYRFMSLVEFLDYIDENVAAGRKQRRDGQAGGDRVLLMSIHRSKGLEWPRVWVVGCNEDILPHARGEEEEERRLFYVAVTRARDELVTSYVQEMATKAGIKKAIPSRYLGLTGDRSPVERRVQGNPADAPSLAEQLGLR